MSMLLQNEQWNAEHKILNNIINHIPQYIFWKDKDLRFRGCNIYFAQQFNLIEPSELYGKTDADFPWGGTPDMQKYIEDDKKIISTGQARLNYEEIQKQPNGEEKIVLVSKTPLLDEKGAVAGLLGIYTDITERKRIEKEAEQLRIDKKVLEEQESMTRLLAASMAHELRTPLRAIESGLEGVGKYLPDMLETYKIAKNAELEIPFIAPMQFQSLSKMLENTKIEARAAFAVIDMLLMNTNSSAIDESKYKIYSIKQCIYDALMRYPLDEEEKSKIHWKMSDFSFHGDDILVIHVIFNLLKNALYYLKAANKGEIQIWCDKNEKFNILHFKDTSQGMDADILPHIFDRFYSRTRHGTGVGLAFCKLVMKSFGGDITCESVKGEYSDFILSFPQQNS